MSLEKYNKYKIAQNYDIKHCLNPLLNEYDDEQFKEFLDYNHYTESKHIPDPLSVINETEFYWFKKKKKDEEVDLIVSHEFDIPKNFITSSKKGQYIDCCYFVGILGEAVKELNREIVSLKNELSKIKEHP